MIIRKHTRWRRKVQVDAFMEFEFGVFNNCTKLEVQQKILETNIKDNVFK